MQIPLNSVDMGLLALDSIGECERFHWILDVAGEINRDLLEKALLSTLSAYPIMRSKLYIKNLKPRRRCIQAVDGTIMHYVDLNKNQDTDNTRETPVEERNHKVIVDWINKPFALGEELPVRVLLVKRGETEFGIIFSFPHSSVDGIRGLRFVQRVLEAYGGNSLTELLLPRYVRLSKRDELLGCARARRAKVKGFYWKIFASLLHRFLIEPFRPPARIFHDQSGTSQEIGYCVRILDGTELRYLESKTKTARVKMNDILLAALFRTIDTWNNLHRRSSKRISIMVPVNIEANDCGDLMSNQVGFVSLSIAPRDRAEPTILLQKVSRKMSSMLRDGIAFWLVYFCSIAHYIPWAVTRSIAKFLIYTRIYVDTVPLSNLGTIGPKNEGGYKLGASSIVGMILIMPVGTPQGLSIGVYTYNYRFYITVTYKAALFSKEKAQMFLDYYLAELKNYPVAHND